jgi:alanyl-tRNA synthetase
MDTQTIRKKYLEFMREHGHVVVPRSQLVPHEDASTLFTGSGMQPMIPYLLGAKHPKGTKITDSQTVFRVVDIEEVGDNSHCTYYEMLGNWSLGDYFKREQLTWIFEFCVEVIGLNPERMYPTCYIGNGEFEIPKDEEAAQIWQELFETKGIKTKVVDVGSSADGYRKGMLGGRIFYYDGKENWWSRGSAEAGTPVGDPCGPDSEIMYEFPGIEHDLKYGPNCHPACDCGRFIEIGNSVFMGYKRTSKGFEKLSKPNIDFGGGLERIAAAAEGSGDMYKISVLWPIVERIQELSGKSYEDYTKAMRVIADHSRAAVWLAVDGVVPSNTQQGYVMRRLMRRAIRYGLELGIANDLFSQLIPTIVQIYELDFPEVNDQKEMVADLLDKEEKLFRQTLRNGVKEFSKMTSNGSLTGEHVFALHDTYGFPAELSIEEATLNNVQVDENWRPEFDRLMNEQKERSRTATQGQFKGGLGGHSEMHKKYHTATHLMYKALRIVLGDHVIQRGSNITEERLRFDFSHAEKMTSEQIAEVESIVNEQIKRDLPMTWQERDTKEALEAGVLGAFGHKYGDTVKVYTAGDPNDEWFSMEICGGPHVDHTSELAESGKKFKITKEEASSAGIRRIKAVLQ